MAPHQVHLIRKIFDHLKRNVGKLFAIRALEIRILNHRDHGIGLAKDDVGFRVDDTRFLGKLEFLGGRLFRLRLLRRDLLLAHAIKHPLDRFIQRARTFQLLNHLIRHRSFRMEWSLRQQQGCEHGPRKGESLARKLHGWWFPGSLNNFAMPLGARPADGGILV